MCWIKLLCKLLHKKRKQAQGSTGSWDFKVMRYFLIQFKKKNLKKKSFKTMNWIIPSQYVHPKRNLPCLFYHWSAEQKRYGIYYWKILLPSPVINKWQTFSFCSVVIGYQEGQLCLFLQAKMASHRFWDKGSAEIMLSCHHRILAPSLVMQCRLMTKLLTSPVGQSGPLQHEWTTY